MTAIALGQGDARLIGLARAISDSGKRIGESEPVS